jgi:two-component system alkaline phosphatase synthesis response regulator PhoP
MSAKILVVDDDPSLVHLMTANLEDVGYTVISGYDGQMAINLARTQKPDLIILDVNMPMTNGLKAMESIRQLPETKAIPIILLSGETSDKIILKAETANRVLHIKKPGDLEEMNSLITQVLQKYPCQ